MPRRARESGAEAVQNRWREHMRFLQAHYLAARNAKSALDRIGAGGPADAVIDRVDAEQGVLTAEGVVQPEVSKILSHRLHGIGIAERSAPAEFGAVWRGPQIEEGRDARREPDKVSRSIGAGQISEPRVVIRHDRNTAQREPL